MAKKVPSVKYIHASAGVTIAKCPCNDDRPGTAPIDISLLTLANIRTFGAREYPSVPFTCGHKISLVFQA